MRAGKKLKEYFESGTVSQKEISEKTGISQASISRMINGTLVLKRETLELIIKNMNLSKDEELELWKAWTLDRGETKAAAYFEKLDKENKKLKKILASIKEL